MGKYIFLCEDSVEGIFSAVYTAWSARVGHMNVKLEILPREGECTTYELFAEYTAVETDTAHAESVARSIKGKISEKAYRSVIGAAMSCAPDKADTIYHFLVLGFAMGGAVINHLSDRYVSRIFELNRFVMNDAHFHNEFLRFEELENNVLIAKCEPQNNIVSIVAEHFSDRFSGENFIIYDVGRHIAAVHRKGYHWVLVHIQKDVIDQLEVSGKDNGYQKLWRTFFDNIAVKERINPELQRNLLRLHYRKYMTEFIR